MLLSLKRWKSRTPPGFAASAQEQNPFTCLLASAASRQALADPGPHRPLGDAGWSSPVARQAHNLKVTGSNPVPATKQSHKKPPPQAAEQSIRSRTPPQPMQDGSLPSAGAIEVQRAVRAGTHRKGDEEGKG